MNGQLRARVASTVIIGLLIAAWSFRVAAKNHATGRQAFLLAQASHFDKLYANLHHPLFYITLGLFTAGGFVLAYEAIAFAMRSLFNRGGDSARVY